MSCFWLSVEEEWFVLHARGVCFFIGSPTGILDFRFHVGWERLNREGNYYADKPLSRDGRMTVLKPNYLYTRTYTHASTHIHKVYLMFPVVPFRQAGIISSYSNNYILKNYCFPIIRLYVGKMPCNFKMHTIVIYNLY